MKRITLKHLGFKTLKRLDGSVGPILTMLTFTQMYIKHD